MATLDELMALVPVDQVAQQLGVDRKTAEQAVAAALPTLVGGLEANAQDSAGKSSLLNALGSHGSLLDGGVDVGAVDTNDGAKIVHNIFGPQTDQVASTLGAGTPGVSNDLMKQLLPILAPIVMAYIAQKMGANLPGASAPQSRAPQQSGGGVLGDVLGSILGGGGKQSGGGLGGVLGGALGQVLGGMLGGGRR